MLLRKDKFKSIIKINKIKKILHNTCIQHVENFPVPWSASIWGPKFIELLNEEHKTADNTTFFFLVITLKNSDARNSDDSTEERVHFVVYV